MAHDKGNRGTERTYRVVSSLEKRVRKRPFVLIAAMNLINQQQHTISVKNELNRIHPYHRCNYGHGVHTKYQLTRMNDLQNGHSSPRSAINDKFIFHHFDRMKDQKYRAHTHSSDWIISSTDHRLHKCIPE